MAICALCGFTSQAALAEQTTDTASNNSPNNVVTTQARLDFVLDIGKFLFFRVGSAAFPTASGTIENVAFTIVPTIPAAAAAPVNGNSVVANWSGASPGFSVTNTNTTLPVEVRSNAGQINIRANVINPLISGANSIPLSQILLTSSDANLPAPLVPNSGTGAAVNVTGTSSSNLVTERSANWTFAYSPASIPTAGNYAGQISFTASSP